MTMKQTGIRFSDEEKEMLERLSREFGVSQSSIIRLLLRLGVRLLDFDIAEILREEIMKSGGNHNGD